MERLHLTINMNTGAKLFFTSDLHLGHNNIISFCQRPFKDVEIMNEALIANWNEVVAPGDIVFALGDIFWNHNTKFMKEVYARLNGTIYFIPGNHDSNDAYKQKFPNVTVLSDVVTLFLILHDEIEEVTYNYQIQLSHIPLMTWPQRIKRNCFHLHGHVHTMLVGHNTGCDANIPKWPNQYDIGVDFNNYAPIEIRDILAKLNLSPGSSVKELSKEVLERNLSE